MSTKSERIKDRAWELHREHGHPEGYVGPCWGPTVPEWAQAKSEEAKREH